MKSSNTGLKMVLAILIIVLLIGIAVLVFLVMNYNRAGGQPAPADLAPAEPAPADLFPTDGPTRDASKMIISEIRNAGDGSIASISLMIPPELVGLTAEVNGVQAAVVPIDEETIRIDIPAGVNTERVEIQIKAGLEVRANCIVNRSDVQRPEGGCIW